LVDDVEAIQRYLLFEKYQQNANLLAESLCRDDDKSGSNNYTTAAAFVEAQADVGMIVHMKHPIHDWLAEDWDVMMMVKNNSSPSTTTTGSSSMSKRRRRGIRSIRPIVLEPNFDLEEQIDDALRAIATRAQKEFEEGGCPHRRRRPNEGGANQEQRQQQQAKRASRNGGPRRHVHSSLQNSNSDLLVLSEKGTRCVAQFYRRDYEIIRQLSHSSTCKETCRLALESIWNRRSPLLLL
jgi:hypothetical protein